MRIIKPEWIAENVPLITCDIHPDGSRFAVGGNSTSGGGKIQIWNMDPVLDTAKEKDQKCPKLLCAMFNHMSCVNCVRWTISGKYLASGADDRLVMIWTYGGNQTKDNLESENWKCIHRLMGRFK
jgi:protein HIRA/HIR1